MKKVALISLSILMLFAAGNVFAAEPGMEQAAAVQSQLVNINEAGAEELAMALDGVGNARAQAIVEYREANGPFASAEALMEVRGIGESIFAANSARIEL